MGLGHPHEAFGYLVRDSLERSRVTEPGSVAGQALPVSAGMVLAKAAGGRREHCPWVVAPFAEHAAKSQCAEASLVGIAEKRQNIEAPKAGTVARNAAVESPCLHYMDSEQTELACRSHELPRSRAG